MADRRRLGVHARRWREEAGLSVRDAARAAHCSHVFWLHLEQGVRRPPASGPVWEFLDAHVIERDRLGLAGVLAAEWWWWDQAAAAPDVFRSMVRQALAGLAAAKPRAFGVDWWCLFRLGSLLEHDWRPPAAARLVEGGTGLMGDAAAVEGWPVALAVDFGVEAVRGVRIEMTESEPSVALGLIGGGFTAPKPWRYRPASKVDRP